MEIPGLSRTPVCHRTLWERVFFTGLLPLNLLFCLYCDFNSLVSFIFNVLHVAKFTTITFTEQNQEELLSCLHCISCS